MSVTYQEAHQRGIDTLAIWNQFAPAFTAGTLTLAQHTADVAEILSHASAVADADSDLEQSRDTRDTLGDALQQLCVQGPSAIEGGLPEGSDLLDDLHPIRAIRMTTKEKTLERARKLHSLWEKVNERHAAAVPVLPEQKAGGKTLAEFTTLMTDLVASLQTVANEESSNANTHRELDQITQQVDRQNKRWYKAWLGEYPEGTPERDALSQIDTGSPSTPPEPPSGELPTALQIELLQEVAPGHVQVSYAPDTGQNADTIVLKWARINQSPDFSPGIPVTLPTQTITNFIPGDVVQFKTVATNASGSVESTVEEITLA